MTIESEIFKRSTFNFKNLIDYGFTKKGSGYFFTKDFLDGEFKAEIFVDKKGEVTGKVIDTGNEEEYLPVRIEHTTSAYAGIVKSGYEEILTDIKGKCCCERYFIYNQSNRITELIYKTYGVEPDFPWAGEPHGVFRNPYNKKWFGLIMDINKSKLDMSINIENSNDIEVMNIKLAPEEIDELVKNDSYYRAYHMNKKYWITMALDETLPDNEIMEHIKESYSYTVK